MTGHLAVIITPGGGKTNEAAKQVAELTKDGVVVVHWFTATHNLAQEAQQTLLAFAPDLKVQVIQGVTREGMCQREDPLALVALVRSAGLPFQKALCGTEEKPCPFFEGCAYRAQFVEAQVYIFTHEHLAIGPDERLAEPDFCVIDESCIPKLVGLEKVDLDDLMKFDRKIGRSILKCLQNGGGRDDLEREGVDAAALLQAADKKNEVIRGNFAFSRYTAQSLNPAPTLRKLIPLTQAALALETLARELMGSSRPEIRSLRLDGSAILIRFRRDLHRDVPYLILDGTGSRQVLEAVFPGVQITQISISRNAVVTQIYNNTVAKMALLAKGGDFLLSKCQRVIDDLRERHESGLIITYKAIEDSVMVPDDDWHINHFGNTRGTNMYKDCSVAVTVGRQEVRADDLWNMAAALNYDNDVPLDLVRDREYREVGYRLRNDDVHWGVQVRRFADPFLDALDQMMKDAETIQAVDRIRSVCATMPKEIYILSSEPTSLIIDELVHLDALSRTRSVDRAEERSGLGGRPVLPLGSKILVELQVYRSARAAQDAVAMFKAEINHVNSNYIYRNQRGLSGEFVVLYTLPGGRGRPRSAKVDNGTSLLSVQQELAAYHGLQVKVKSEQFIRMLDGQEVVHFASVRSDERNLGEIAEALQRWFKNDGE